MMDAPVIDADWADWLDWVASVFLSPPDADSVALWRSEVTIRLFEAIGIEFGQQEAGAHIRAALEAGEPHTVALDLSVAYTRLFEGIAGMPAVGLYQAAYTTDMPAWRLFGQSAQDMAQLLAHARLQLAGASHEPADHLAVELALLAALIRCQDRVVAGQVQQQLQTWLEPFAACCRQHDPHGFYGAVATLLQATPGLALSHPTVPLSRQERSFHVE
ncbi:TorD/DmsD family molecular chaperone [Silvimonas iriomotensis]|uniref:Chaperone TorD involved in molybdoenzyme TorA maturation n=1 Tax=Silvimonas iriomotensis TaxID=449662 RepID=A0ABQ2P4U1_9NEIS|nr:molecular chaperone TorD family protein [Silvimonas iriomotensis]GGP17825.1 hypothetical protein GCM10010970_01740 [Silvimonas iriomotensis]